MFANTHEDALLTTGADRVVVVGAGLSGLAAAIRLAEAGREVVVLETHRIGGGASTRNQGWLHSGGWFARSSRDLARFCHEALDRTIEFSPNSLEPGFPGMLYVVPGDEVAEWTAAWDTSGIPFEPCTDDEVETYVPGLERDEHSQGFLLPDRAFRFDRLIADLTAVAGRRGAAILNGRSVERFRVVGDAVVGVETTDCRFIEAETVVLAGNATGMPLLRTAFADRPGRQVPFELVPVKTHLTSLRTDVPRWPFCIVGEQGFHHIPRGDRGVFGLQRWLPVVDPLDQSVVPAEIERLHATIGRCLPGFEPEHHADWAGTTMQAMHDEQIVPGAAPLPTVVDHATYSPPLRNLLSVFPGRASLWDRSAEDVVTTLQRLHHRPSANT